MRYGGALGDGGHFRVYAKTSTATTRRIARRRRRGDDAAEQRQAAFAPTGAVAARRLTVQGDAYHGNDRPGAARRARSRGANLLARWSAASTAAPTASLQAYYDHTERDQPLTFRKNLDTLDIELQYSHRAGAAASAWCWGGGYRHGRDRVDQRRAFALPAGERAA